MRWLYTLYTGPEELDDDGDEDVDANGPPSGATGQGAGDERPLPLAQGGGAWVWEETFAFPTPSLLRDWPISLSTTRPVKERENKKNDKPTNARTHGKSE